MAAPLMNSPVEFMFPSSYAVLFFLVFLIFVYSVSRLMIAREKLSRWLIIILFLILYISIFGFLSSLFSDLPVISFQRYGTMAFLMVSILIYSSCNNQLGGGFEQLCDWITIFSIPLFVVTIFVYFFGVGLDSRSFTFLSVTIDQPVINGVRAAGFWGNPNTFASFIFYTSPFVTYATLIRRSNITLFVIFSMVMLIGNGISLSRTGLASYFIFLISFLFIYFSPKAKLFSVFFGVLFVCFVIFSKGAVTGLNLDLSRLSEMSLSGRELAWVALLTSFYDNYILGVGFGVSQEVILAPNNIDFPAHNIYLMLLSEVGFFGFFALMLLLATPIGVSFIGLRRSPLGSDFYKLYALFLSFFVSVLVQQFFETHLFRYNYAMVLWLYLFGCAVGGLKILNKSNGIRVI